MSNVRQLHYPKSSNRSENRPLIPIVYGLGGLETEAQKSTLPDGWHSSGKVQFGVYRKEEVDRVVSDEEIFEYQEKIRKHENHK